MRGHVSRRTEAGEKDEQLHETLEEPSRRKRDTGRQAMVRQRTMTEERRAEGQRIGAQDGDEGHIKQRQEFGGVFKTCESDVEGLEKRSLAYKKRADTKP